MKKIYDLNWVTREEYIKFLNALGHKNLVSRKELEEIQKNYGIPIPFWLERKEFRVQGVKPRMYQLPSLENNLNQVFRSAEVKDVFLKLKYDIDKITKISRLDEVLQVSKKGKYKGINLEKRVLSLRYGIEGGITKTLEEVAEELGLSRQRIFQLEQKALQRLERYTGKTMNLTLTESSRQKY